MANASFFGKPKPGSAVKAAIVSKYFWAWAKVLYKRAERQGLPLQYLDLYAGCGRYDDGTLSTPLLVLQKAIADDTFRQLVIARLNDIDPENCRALKHAIQLLPGVESLHYPPIVENRAVDEAIARQMEDSQFPPTLSFVDPWGYKGLSARLIRALTRQWGCDCIFFFNYNRINLGLSNEFVTETVDDLFGKERAESLRGRLEGSSPQAREKAILEELKLAIAEGSRRRVFQFAFRSDTSNRTSHYLVLVTKEPVGFEIMKKIMAKESSEAPQGVPGYEFIPVEIRRPSPEVQQLTFLAQPEPIRPLDLLQERLLERFAGRSMAMIEVCREYNRIADHYIARNYKDAFLALESKGRISCDPPVTMRPRYKGAATLADWVQVTFPPKDA